MPVLNLLFTNNEWFCRYSMDKITLKGEKDSYIKLTQRAKLDLSFVFLTVCAAIICFLGFKMNSPSVIVGAMVVSPLLFSVVSMGAACFRKDWKTFGTGFTTLIIGIIAAIIAVVSINLLSHIQEQSEILDRIRSAPLDYFFVAFFSGVAGTFAFFWPDIIEAIAGIAISVALIPPVVMLGIGIVQFDHILIVESALIVAVNVLGIFLASLLTSAGLNLLLRYKQKSGGKHWI